MSYQAIGSARQIIALLEPLLLLSPKIATISAVHSGFPMAHKAEHHPLSTRVFNSLSRRFTHSFSISVYLSTCFSLSLSSAKQDAGEQRQSTMWEKEGEEEKKKNASSICGENGNSIVATMRFRTVTICNEDFAIFKIFFFTYRFTAPHHLF